jgi:glycosyltransferase involved in cell wall biosynthesis
VFCLYYCDWFEQYTTDLTLAVEAESHNVALIVREQAPEFTGQARAADGDESRRRLRAGISDLHVLGGRHRSLKSLFEIFQIARKSRPDVFHLQQTGDPRFLWLAFRMPTALTLHEPFARAGNHRKRGARQSVSNAVQWLYRRACDLIIVHTTTSFQSLSPSERRKAVVIPHGSEASVLAPAGDSKTILFFGRADGYKGIDTLLAAMDTVWTSEPKARLQILASSNSFRCDIPDERVSATWDGYSNAELEAALATARVIALPYTTAAGSGVGAQAYGTGRPIVASDLDGLRELVSQNELLVKPNDVGDLARGLLQVLTHDYGVQPIDPERTWPGVARAHLSAYEEMLSRTKKRPLR